MYLLDTNVLSEFRKVQHRRTDPQFVSWAQSVELHSLYVSVITMHELEVGVFRMFAKDARQGSVLRGWMITVLEGFAHRTLAVDLPVALRSAQLSGHRSRSLTDALIASTAYVHGLKVVTRNTSDFEDTGVEIINPWL